MRDSRVLVTGGLGFMGSDMVRYLVSEDLCGSVSVLDNFSYSADVNRVSLAGGDVEIHRGDIRDSSIVSRLVRKVDVVLNFAAETHNDNSLERPLDFVSTNVDGVATLLDACREHNVYLHQISTDEVFGDLPLDSNKEFDENSSLRPSSPYSASKASAELLVLAWVRSFDIRASISNAANNFGEFQHSEKLIPQLMERAFRGERARLYGRGSNMRDWLYVRDHSRAVWAIVSEQERKTSDRYVISAGQVFSNLEVSAAVNKGFGLPENYYQLVEDRPGHDLKYSSSSALLRRDFDWSPIGPSLQDWIAAESRSLILKKSLGNV